MEENTAYLSNKNDCIIFSYGSVNVRFKGPYSLEKIFEVVDWKNGCIVVNAKYTHSSELIEDYIDMRPILDKLYINSEEFLFPIKNVEVKNV